MKINDIIVRASSRSNARVAVAAAHDEDVLLAVCDAKKKGISRAVLVGNTAKITEILTKIGAEAQDFAIIDAENDADCASLAVKEVREGRADLLMKGLMGTGTLMRAVVDKENGLRTGRLLSHVMFYEVPGHDRLLALTDGGMNTYPDLEKKAGILENAAILLRSLGYAEINAACICGAEVVDQKIQATVDADALAQMHGRWSEYNMNVIGPVGLDLAISEQACAHKGYEVAGAGKADILLVPTYEVGNGIGKSLTYFAKAKSAGIIVGASVPIVLVSRADTAETKLASIALGVVAAAQ